MHMSTKSDSNIESAAATVGDTSFSADSTSSQFKFSSAVDARANSQQAAAGTETKLSDIVVITRSQKNSFHLQLAKEQDEQWQQQFKFLKGKPAKLLKLHEEWAPEGAWTIFPLIRQLAALKAKWFFFCEDQTSVNFNGLLQILDQYSSKQIFCRHAVPQESVKRGHGSDLLKWQSSIPGCWCTYLHTKGRCQPAYRGHFQYIEEFASWKGFTRFSNYYNSPLCILG
jgi:hypothetical protein